MMQLNAQWVYKALFGFAGGLVGWVVAEFRPTFPMLAVMVVFVVYDSVTAYLLGRRAYKKYPKAFEQKPKFKSSKFSDVVTRTIPTRSVFILLGYLLEHWVLNHSVPLTMMFTTAVCGEQLLSILENLGSCRDDRESKLWHTIRRLVIEKTERHVDVSLDEFKKIKAEAESKEGGEDHE